MFVSHGMNLALIFSIQRGGEWGGGDSQMGKPSWLRTFFFRLLFFQEVGFTFEPQPWLVSAARECSPPCLECFPLPGFCSSLVKSPWLGCLSREQMPSCNLKCLHLFLSLYLFAQRIARSAPKMYSAQYFFLKPHTYFICEQLEMVIIILCPLMHSKLSLSLKSVF